MLLWFGHGCSGDRMLLERKCYYALGMDALVIGCSFVLSGEGAADNET